jgi:uncharacterized protein YndB with AHSA1/START domain
MSNITKLLMLLSIGLLLAVASVWFVGGKKKVSSVTTTVNASPEQIFPYLVETDLKRQWLPSLIDQELIPSLEDIEAEREPIFEEGVEISSTMRLNDENQQMQGEVIRYSENELVTVKSRNENITITHFFRLKEKGGRTEIDYRKIVRHNGIQRLLSVFEEDTTQVDVEEEISRLARLVESDTDDLIPN